MKTTTKRKPAPTLADQLRALRGERTQLQAAAALGVPAKTYVNWEQGRFIPRPFVAEAVLQKAREFSK